MNLHSLSASVSVQWDFPFVVGNLCRMQSNCIYAVVINQFNIILHPARIKSFSILERSAAFWQLCIFSAPRLSTPHLYLLLALVNAMLRQESYASWNCTVCTVIEIELQLTVSVIPSLVGSSHWEHTRVLLLLVNHLNQSESLPTTFPFILKSGPFCCWWLMLRSWIPWWGFASIVRMVAATVTSSRVAYLILLHWTPWLESPRHSVTGLLSTSALLAPAAKKTYILYETYLDSSPECSLCISKKPHTLASP